MQPYFKRMDECNLPRVFVYDGLKLRAGRSYASGLAGTELVIFIAPSNDGDAYRSGI